MLSLNSMRRRWAVLPLVLGLGIAAALTLGNVRLASSQAVILSADRVQEAIPLDDPSAPVWDRAKPVEIALSAQNMTPPMGGASRSVTARALYDDKRLYVLLQWPDKTENLSAQKVHEFRDAAAVAFPSTAGPTVPSFCMGQANSFVNIWHWKADWQADLDSGRATVQGTYPNAHADLYPQKDDITFDNPGAAVGNLISAPVSNTPIENLIAGGFGTLTTPAEQPVAGVGRWQDGKWRVLFARDLQVSGDNLATFQPGQTANVNFAVWDGAAGERDGQKSVSQFVNLQLTGKALPGTAAEGGLPLRPIIVAVVVIFLIFLGGITYLAWPALRRG